MARENFNQWLEKKKQQYSGGHANQTYSSGNTDFQQWLATKKQQYSGSGSYSGSSSQNSTSSLDNPLEQRAEAVSSSLAAAGTAGLLSGMASRADNSSQSDNNVLSDYQLELLKTGAAEKLRQAKDDYREVSRGWGSAGMQSKGGWVGNYLREKAGSTAESFDWQAVNEALNNKYAAKMELDNLEYLQRAMERQAKLDEMAQEYAGLDSEAKIALAEENLEQAQDDYGKASRSWGTAAMQAKGGWVGNYLREKAGVEQQEFDWQAMHDAKETRDLTKTILRGAKDEKWWEEAAADQSALEAEAKNSTEYQQQLQDAPTTRYGYTARNGFSIGQSKYITDEEIAIYETLKLTDPQGAERYWQILEYDLNRRAAEAQAQGLKNASGLGNFSAYLGSSLAAPLGIFNTAYEAIREFFTGEYRPIDLNSDAYIGARVQSQAQQNLLENIDEPFIQFLAQTGLSMSSYLSKLPFGPAGALIAMSSDVANSTAYDTLERGGTPADAFWNGMLAGTIEAMAEKLPLDRLFKMARGGTKLLSKAGIKNVLSQAGIEGSEEVVSSYLQTLTDMALMGDQSQYELTVQNYMEEGMSEAEARRQASIDTFITEPLVNSFFGGAISGGVFGAGATAIGSLRGGRGDQVSSNINDTEIPEPVRAGQATVIKSPYQGITPIQESSGVGNSIAIGQQTVDSAKNNISQATATSAAEGKSVRSGLRKIYMAIFDNNGGQRDVAVNGLSFAGEPYYVRVNKSAINKIISDPNMSAEKLAVIEFLDDVIANGEYVGSGNYVAKPNRKKKDIIRYDYFETQAAIGDGEYIVTFDVEVIPGRNNYRTHKVINKIELTPVTGGEAYPVYAAPASGVETGPVPVAPDRTSTLVDQSITQSNSDVNSIRSSRQNDTNLAATEQGDVDKNRGTVSERQLENQSAPSSYRSTSAPNIAQGQGEVNVRAAQTAVQDRAEQLRQAVEDEDTQAVMESMGEQGLKVYLDNKLYQNKQQEREYSLYYRAGMEGVAYEQVAGKFGDSLNPALREMAFNAGKMDAETVRNAVYFGKDSGLVRDKNFRKAKISAKLARALDALAKVTGVRIRFADNLPDGVNAVYRDGEIIISLKADDPVKVLVGHEIVHRLRETDPRAYNALYAFVEQYMGAEDFQRSVSMRQELYQQETGEMDLDGAIEETVADAIGRMLGDTAFFESFVMERPNLAQKIKDILQTLIGRIRRWLGVSVELSQSQRQEFAELQAHLEELMRTMDAAMQRAEIRTKARGPQGTGRNNTASTTKKALSAKFAQEVDEWYRLPAEERAKEGGNFYVGTTSDALKSIGVDDYKIYWGKAKVAAIMKKHPKMTLDVIKKVPQVIEKPIIVMQSKTVLNSITLLGEVTTNDGTPVLATMQLRPQNKRGEVMDFGIITSAYDHSKAQSLINSSDILYIEPNKNRTTAWTETLGLQLPSVISKRGSIDTVTYVEENVKGTAAFDGKQGKTTMQLAMEKAKERANDKLNKATDNNSIAVNSQNDTGNIRPGKTKFSLSYDKKGQPVVMIDENIFANQSGKSPHKVVADYLKRHIGEVYTIIESGQKVYLGADLPGEYTHSKYSQKLQNRPTLLRTKNRAVSGLGEMVEIATNRRWEEAKHRNKHAKDAKYGFYRYDTKFAIPFATKNTINPRVFDAEVIIRNADDGKKYLYDIVNIKEDTASRVVTSSEKKPRAYQMRGTRNGILLDSTLPQEPGSVNNSIALNSQNDTEISQTNEEKTSISTKKLVEQYGAIPQGERAAREVQVPKRTGEEQTVRRFVRTVLESEATPEEMVPAFDQEIAAGNFSYEPSSDSNAWGKAQKSYSAFGEEGALRQWRAVVNGERPANKEDIALGELLYIKAAEAGETQKAMRLAAEVAAEGTRAGQVVQAMRLLKKMSGAGQLYYINLTKDKLQKDLIKKYGAKAPELEIPEALAQNLAGAKTQAEIDEATEQILGYIAAQMPSTWVDKWNAWRYLAMLGNPRTHIRNLVGNGVFLPAVTMKNIIGTSIEAATNKVLAPMFHKGPVERTKTIRGALPFTGGEYRDFAINDFDEMYDILTSGGKMNPSDEIRDRQRIFKNRILEWARKQNFNLLEKEDGIFLKTHYVRAMVQYLQANNVDLDQLRNIDSSGHTPEEQRRISEYQNATDGELLNFIDKIRHLQEPKNADKINHLLGEVQPELAAEIERLTGVDVHDFEHNIRGDVINHIDIYHGEHGLTDHSMADTKDMARIAYVLQNYDDIELGTDDQGNERLSQHWTNADKSPAKKVKISKKIDGTMYIIEAVPDTARKKLQLVTAYIAQNKGAGQTLNMPEGPQLTSETPFASAPGANIAQRNGGVKAKLPKKGQIDRDALRMLERARNYAIREAQKATYRDASAVANALNRFSHLNAGTQILTESLMPFKKTPVNLLKRGVRYSPLGILETLIRQTYLLKKDRITGSEFIDNLAAGLSGTMVLGLGYLLASLGLLSGGGDDDKEGQFQELQGWQEYSLQLGDTYYSIDWAAPMSLPLFVGAELYNLFKVDQEVEAKDFYNALTMITEPMFNLSMLNGINNTIEAARYGTSPLTDILIEVGQGYVGQAVPTLLGQIARTIDDTRRTTYTDKNSSWPDDLQYWLQRNRNKIPGLSQGSQPYIDAWGRLETSDNAALRAFENFISPGYISRTNSSKLEEELQRLYDQTGESGVLPSSAPRYFNVDGRRLDLTAAEYSEYAVARGQTAYHLLEDITTSSGYRALSDAAKAAVVEDAFDYANQTAKAEVSRYEVDPWIAKANQAQQQLGVSTSEYLLLKEEYGTQALTADKVYDAYDAGVDVGEYLAFREELSDYAGDNVSQAEARRMLDQTGWTRQQKRAMWNVINKGWKNNPY